MGAFLRKYGTGSGADVYLPMIKRGVVDQAVSADWTPAAGDVKVSIDGAAAANIGTLPTAIAMGNGAQWKFVFADAELQGKRVVVTVADSATKAVEDQFFVIETYGNASAMYQADLSAANLPANVTQFGGTNGTFSGGRPEVNTTHLAGNNSAVSAMSAFWAGQETGTAQAGGASTITLRSGASSVDNLFELCAVVILAGTGAGQVRKAAAGGYNGTSKVLTVTTAWETQPDNTSVYMIMGRIE